MVDTLLCQVHETVLSVLHKINQNGKGAIFVVNDKKLKGLLTDGDIRRALLEGHTLEDQVGTLVKKDFVYIRHNEDYRAAIDKMTTGIKIVPVVNDDFEIIDCIESLSDVNVPIVSPDLKGNELKYLTEAFLSTWISSSGEYVVRFEKDFARFCKCRHGVAVSNGTVALHIALTALGIGEGDEVIVPDLTFAATINAVLHAKATPVIVDIERDSWCIDPHEIEKAITSKTKAIIPVHLYGQPCDMDAIMKIAKKHKLFVVEDCAEAHGARYAGKPVGSFGDIGCFSFFGNKIVTTGEGGMCVTNSAQLDEKLRMLRDHGMSRKKKYWHECIGFNYRMTNLQAAIGVAQLERVQDILAGRREIEEHYRRSLGSLSSIELQRDDLPKREKVTWLVSVIVKGISRDACIAKLKKNNIDARPFFYPLSQMPIYALYVFSNTVSQDIGANGVSLPTERTLPQSIIEKIQSVLQA